MDFTFPRFWRLMYFAWTICVLILLVPDFVCADRNDETGGEVVIKYLKKPSDTLVKEMTSGKLFTRLGLAEIDLQEYIKKENVASKDRVQLKKSSGVIRKLLSTMKGLPNLLEGAKTKLRDLKDNLNSKLATTTVVTSEFETETKRLMKLISDVITDELPTFRKEMDSFKALQSALLKFQAKFMKKSPDIAEALKKMKALSKKHQVVVKSLNKARIPDVPHWLAWGPWSRCPGMMARCVWRERRKICMDDSGTIQSSAKCLGQQPTEEEQCAGCLATPEGGRSTGGQLVYNISMYSYIVSISKSIQYGSEGTGHFCGGIILTDVWIMTAAHCVCQNGYCCSKDFEFLDSKCDLKQWKVTAGLLKPHTSPKKGHNDDGQTRQVASVIIHEDYETNAYGHPLRKDIAMIKLDAPLDFTKRNVRPCDLPTSRCRGPADVDCIRHSEWHGWDCEIAGWGVFKGNSASEVLRRLDVATYSDSGNIINATQIVVGTTTVGKGTPCQGDSGGPLVCTDGTVWPHRSVVIGIMSLITLRGCIRSSEGKTFHTDVPHLLPWISDKIAEWSDWSQTCHKKGDTRIRVKYCLFHSYFSLNNTKYQTFYNTKERCSKEEKELCQETGKVPSTSGKKVVSDFEEYAYMVYISNGGINGDINPYCAGIIVSDSWIMTTALCACINGRCCSNNNEYSSTRCELEKWIVVAGRKNPHTNKTNERVGQKRGISKVIIHENYVTDAFGTPLINNIAMLKLDSPLDFTKANVQPANIPTSTCRGTPEETCVRHGEYVNWGCKIAGWGRFSSVEGAPRFSERLRELDVYTNGYKGGFIETEALNGGMSCSGDSGGPLMCRDETVTPPRSVVIGIISHGFADCSAVLSRPTFHTSISNLLPWVSDKISEWGEWSGTCNTQGDIRTRSKPCLFHGRYPDGNKYQNFYSDKNKCMKEESEECQVPIQ